MKTMENIKHPANSPHFLQKLANDKLDRSAFATTMKLGQSLEFSNGTTVIFKKAKGSKQTMLVLLVPRDVDVYWEVSKREKVDEQTNCN